MTNVAQESDRRMIEEIATSMYVRKDRGWTLSDIANARPHIAPRHLLRLSNAAARMVAAGRV